MPNAFNEEVSYMTIFPETEFNNITEAYSVYGAGAFFVKLMGMVNDPEKIKPKDGFEDLSLQARRPDLWNVPITQANIDNTRPYLEKVNELLLNHLNKDDHNLVWQDVATGKSSFISYNHIIAQTEAYLKTFGTLLKEIAPYFSAGMYNDISWALAQTGMSKTDLNVLLNIDSAKGWFDTIVTPGSTDIDAVKFKIITGLDDAAVYALVYNNIPFDKRDKELGGLYINADTTDTAPIEYNDGFKNLTEARLKRIQIFLTLATKLEWDYVTLNAVLAHMHLGTDIKEKDIKSLAQIVYLLDQWSYGPARLARIINAGFKAFDKAAAGYTEHNKLKHTIQVAIKLNISFEALLWYLTNPDDNTSDYNQFLNALFQLQIKTEQLEKAGMKLQDYITVLSASKKDLLQSGTFNKWYDNTIAKLATTHKHFQLSEGSTTNFDLQKTLFNQWVHEFCVFTGLQEPLVSNLLLGIFGISDINADKTALSSLNRFLMTELVKATNNIIEKNKTVIKADKVLQAVLLKPAGLSALAAVSEAKKSKEASIKALTDAQNVVIVSGEKNRSDKARFFNNFLPYATLVQKLNLDVFSVNFIGRYLINVTTKKRVKEISIISELTAEAIIQYKNVYTQIKKTENHQLFIDALKTGSVNINDIELIMGWPNDRIENLYNTINIGGKKVITLLNQLSFCFKAALDTGINVNDLFAYVQSLKNEDFSNAVLIDPTNIPDNSHDIYRIHWGRQLELDRDRLVPLLLWALNQLHADINSPDHLSNYFLCDVEMAGLMDIAPLREATDAVQTYLSRCKSGLEAVAPNALKSITPEEWQWIPNFRIWQAEQMLRTYPENYIQPGIRSNATDLFKNTINDLQGSQLTNEKAEAALLKYLDEWVDLVNADIADAGAYKRYSNYFEKDVETLFLVSKSKVKENTFYFSYKETDPDSKQENWAQWKEIPVKINADTVSLIFAFNRLNIFWSEQSTVTDSDTTVTNGKYTIHSVTIKCTYQNIDGSWATTQTIKSFPFYIDLVSESRLLLGVVPTYNSTCSFADARGIIISFDVTIPSAPNTQFQVFFPGRENAGITYSPVVMNCLTPSTPYTKCDPVAVTLGCSELIALGPLRRNWTIGTQFTFAPPTTNPVFQNSNNWENGPFSPANPYWKKLGLMPVSDPVNSGMDDVASYIHLFCGPLHLPPQYNYDILLKPGVTDPKLVEFVNTFNAFSTRKKNADNIGNQNSWSNVMACGLCQLFLNQAMDTVIMSNSKEAFAYKEINAESVGFYFSNTNNGFNIQPDYYNGIPLLNYQLTYGQGNAGSHALTEGKYLFTENIKSPVKKYYAVRNRVGAFYFALNNVDYIFSMDVPLSTIDSSKIIPGNGVMEIVSPMVGDIPVKASGFKVERIASTNISQLRIEAHNKGLSFFNRTIQEADIGVTRTTFSGLKPYFGYVISPLIDSDSKINFDGAFGIYARELFFHLPMAIANLLAKNLQYDDARRWYHFVCNSLGVDAGTVKDVWQYAPFHLYDKTKTKPVPGFDPDIIAENDLEVYMKWTLEQYVLFILDFADNEFIQETWESLSAATQLYFEAEDLLGQEPQMEDLVSRFENNTISRTFPNVQQINDYFGVPTNANLKALWARVKDRLYKLRNGLNINGEKQMPSMYGTAIDPARLLLASQYGGINPYDSSSLSVNNSVYRFRELAPHTESVINIVVEFGSQLLSALVQKDNEQLQALQATHQVNMLNVVSNMYQYKVDEAAKEIDILTANLATVQAQLNYYQGLINKGLLPAEIGSITANVVAAELQNSAAALRTGAVIGHLIPTVFGLADGDLQPGSAIDSLATILNETGQASQTISQILAADAEHTRRFEEWQFQQDQAQSNIEQINESINAASIRLNIARENMKQYQLSVSQANEVLNYLTNKFTNADLYTWMSGQMTSLYFTAYQLALSSLHSLQNAYRYELDDAANFIPGNSWNTLQKGLLAGETLKLALARLQDAYINNNVRRLEIEQIFSLKEIAINWDGFKNNGEDLNFYILLKTGTNQPKQFGALLGDYTYYKIKTVDVSIPAVLGPYQTFNATLTQTAASVKKNENQSAISNNNKIIISRGINDNGVFSMSENDGRYLPFEGNGAISTWTLNMDAALVANVSDIIFTIKFNVK